LSSKLFPLPALSKGEGAIKVMFGCPDMAPFPLGRVGDGTSDIIIYYHTFFEKTYY
jgi:hypothetical protein